jgi:hypothetical protein
LFSVQKGDALVSINGTQIGSPGLLILQDAFEENVNGGQLDAASSQKIGSWMMGCCENQKHTSNDLT